MKNSIIKINDYIFGALVVFMVASGVYVGGPVVDANTSFNAFGGQLVGGLMGLIGGAMVSGAWFVLSGIYAELVRMNARDSVANNGRNA